MTQINMLSTIEELSGEDLLPIWDTSNGDARKGSLNLLLAFIAANVALTNFLIRQNAVPTSTGFTVTIASGNTWLLLTPTAGFASGTIVLPTGVDGNEVIVNCTQAITALSVNGGSAGVIGAPTSLAANGFFRLRFDTVSNTWYRIG